MNRGIYEIVCEPTGNRYVGSAVDFAKRWKLHRHHLNRGTHHSRYMQSSWKKHGSEQFTFRPLLICSKANLLFYEQRALDGMKPKFNSCPTAGSPAGVKHSAETRAKLSASKIGNQAFLGQKHRPETLEKMSAAKKGKPSKLKGRPRLQSSVAATAAAHRGRKRSAETCQRISESRKGRKNSMPRSIEYREKMSQLMKRRPPNPDRDARMAATKRGKPWSDKRRAVYEASRTKAAGAEPC